MTSTRHAPLTDTALSPHRIAVRFEDVWFSYGELPVLKAASFHVHAGEFIALVGANGAGKTTVLKLILGLEKPTRGSISLFPYAGTDLDEQPAAGSLVGYVPQNMAWDLAFPVSVREVVAMGLLEGGRRLLSPAAKRAERAAVDEALELCGVVDLAERPYTALSGGQRRRVLVARGLAAKPRLLILDEPTANMDVESEARLFATLEALKGKTTILIVTHDSTFVSALTDVVLCVGESDGRGARGAIVRHRTEPAEHAPPNRWGGKAALVIHDEAMPDNCPDCAGLPPGGGPLDTSAEVARGEAK